MSATSRLDHRAATGATRSIAARRALLILFSNVIDPIAQECQKSDWKEHKKVCPVFKTLHKWNRTDWG
jgi:hypothetical protein